VVEVEDFRGTPHRQRFPLRGSSAAISRLECVGRWEASLAAGLVLPDGTKCEPAAPPVRYTATGRIAKYDSEGWSVDGFLNAGDTISVRRHCGVWLNFTSKKFEDGWVLEGRLDRLE